MNEDIVNEIRKEAFIEILKTGIRSCYPPAVAEVYCHQIDDMKHFAKLLEAIRKSNLSYG